MPVYIIIYTCLFDSVLLYMDLQCHLGDATQRFQSFGLKPASCIKGRPTLVKKLAPGTVIGYGCTYETAGEEWVATFPVGYADGYWRHLSTAWFVVRDLTGVYQSTPTLLPPHTWGFLKAHRTKPAFTCCDKSTLDLTLFCTNVNSFCVIAFLSLSFDGIYIK